MSDNLICSFWIFLTLFFFFFFREEAQLLISVPEQEQLIGDRTEVGDSTSQTPLGIPIDDTKPASWVK